MIDDPVQVEVLMAKMEASLPIPARPVSGLVRSLKSKGVDLPRRQALSIKKVFYLGDEVGISCDVTPPGMEKTPIICSLTHLRVPPAHPLAKEIRAYQVARSRRLARGSGGSKF
jgi:hypothetical protein